MSSSLPILPLIIGILLCFGLAAALGSNRKIGFIGAFLCCLILSPLVGYFFIISSDRLDGQKDLLYKPSFMIAGVIIMIIGILWVVGLFQMGFFWILGVALFVCGLILTGVFDRRKKDTISL